MNERKLQQEIGARMVARVGMRIEQLTLPPEARTPIDVSPTVLPTVVIRESPPSSASVGIYVDALFHRQPNEIWRHRESCHLFSDDYECDLLHAFARKIGLRREWFQQSDRFPHYDLTRKMRMRAVRAGAIEASRDDLRRVLVLRRWMRKSPCMSCGPGNQVLAACVSPCEDYRQWQRARPATLGDRVCAPSTKS